MSKYLELLNNPPKLSVKENAREIVIDLVSCMCDNRKKITLKKNDDGDFKLNSHRDAYSNFQIKHDKDEIEWEADDANWKEVFEMINSGTCKIEKVRSR
jgi:hypothetical protein